MGSKKKNQKLSLMLEGDMLEAVKGNAGFFTSCGGFADEILSNSYASKKVSLTLGQANQVLLSIQEVLSGSKYPNKTGKEYNGIVAFSEFLRSEMSRQLGS
ncbi:MAG: hypothetical protein KME36_12330 [Candidatus Thiodiazotropha sp. (ex Lucina pensylvanica)]|nr:hypothetical protein [Candidatus Thiodiazotropha sp. (ex Lucina pensylvanica)]MBT3051796.1 hypothetical protein [Candidatus Thiodiazotropha sp. (ex Codakia orbicularis)]